jgi:hypothetical protein
MIKSKKEDKWNRSGFQKYFMKKQMKD